MKNNVGLKRKRILFIGRLTIDNTPCAGEVMKNQLFCKRLEAAGGQIRRFNVTKYHSRITFLILYIKLALDVFTRKYNRIIVSSYDSLARRVIDALGVMGFSNKTIYWVIGGGISRKIENGEIKSRYYTRLDKIVVEDKSIQTHLETLGFNNAMTVPNFKPTFNIRKPQHVKKNRFVFVSRITPLKGCDIILSAVKELNNKKFKFDVDFYGHIESGYPFEEYIADMPNVHYKGVLSLKSKSDYEFLGQYTALLFPTFYPNEGFPGTMIDGFISGLPIITTKWRYNSNILVPGKHGWLLDIQDSSSLASVMEEIIEERYDLEKISKNCLDRAKDFDTAVVLSDDFLLMMSLI